MKCSSNSGGYSKTSSIAYETDLLFFFQCWKLSIVSVSQCEHIFFALASHVQSLYLFHSNTKMINEKLYDFLGSINK